MSEQSSSSFWSFAKESWLIAAAGMVIGLLSSFFVTTAWGVIVTWFGFIYIIAFTVALLVLLIAPAKSLDDPQALQRFWWFVSANAIAVALTLIYSAINGALFSGTPTGTVVLIQLFHSTLFFVASLLVAALYRAVQTWTAARSVRSHLGRSRV